MKKKIESKQVFILMLTLIVLLSFILTSCTGNKTVKVGRYVNREASEESLIHPTYVAIEDNNRASIEINLARSYLPNGEYVIKGDKLTFSTLIGEFTFKIKNEKELILESFPDDEPLKKGSLYIYEEDSKKTTGIEINQEQGKEISDKEISDKEISDKETNNKETNNKGKENLSDLPPMVMVNNKLYMDTGKIAEMKKCGTWDGAITSQVAPNQKPTENNQSNFGVGFGYQYGGEEGIDVYMNDKWYVFREVSDK